MSTTEFIDGPVICEKAEWEKLSEAQRQFLRDAEDGGMRYCVSENGVCAWGVAIAGVFSMPVEWVTNDIDGYLVTLAEEVER